MVCLALSRTVLETDNRPKPMGGADPDVDNLLCKQRAIDLSHAIIPVKTFVRGLESGD